MQPMYPAMVNSPQTELTSAINSTVTTIAVANAAALPDAPNLATIGIGDNSETILYTGKSGNNLTGVTRGFQGPASAWGAGQKVARHFTAYDHDTFRHNIEALRPSKTHDLLSGSSRILEIPMETLDQSNRFGLFHLKIFSTASNLSLSASALFTVSVGEANKAPVIHMLSRANLGLALIGIRCVYPTGVSAGRKLAVDINNLNIASFAPKYILTQLAGDPEWDMITPVASYVPAGHTFIPMINLTEIHNSGPVVYGNSLVYGALSSSQVVQATEGFNLLKPSSGQVTQILHGEGSPEEAVSADKGSLYLRYDGAQGTTTYYKHTGTGNTGWKAIA